MKKNKKPSDSELKKFGKEATARFERLSLVTNVLRGPERARYDHFLRNGFPAWRGTGYYYERFRPGLGSVLVGLFIFVGGAVHYAALFLSYKRHREFVTRYIKHARRMAWGDEGSIGAIPGLEDGGASPAAAAASGSDSQQESMQWNRKQKREMERQKKKEGKNPVKSAKAAEKARTEGISTPIEAESPTMGPVGAKKRTVAENGKVLIVDSVGNVFLEQETEEGGRQEFLLDVSIVASARSITMYTDTPHSQKKSHARLFPTQSSCVCRFFSGIALWANSSISRLLSTLLGRMRAVRKRSMRLRRV